MDICGSGAPKPLISKLQQPIDFLKLPSLEKHELPRKVIEKYQKGFSTREIALQLDCSKSKVLRILKRNSVNTRPKGAIATFELHRRKGKACNKPFYGFCYMDGELTKHPVEFPILQLIHSKWQSQLSVYEIVCHLNKKGVKSRERKKWSWAVIRKIVNRFEQKTIMLHEGGKYELR